MTAIATDNMLLTAPEVAIVAGAEPKRPCISIVAHTGGVMRVPGWGDVVVDLAGMDVTGAVAILSDHDSTRRGIVGHGQAEVVSNQLIVNGNISATTVAAKEVVDAARNGFPRQASVGVEVLEFRRGAGCAGAAAGRSRRSASVAFMEYSKRPAGPRPTAPISERLQPHIHGPQ